MRYSRPNRRYAYYRGGGASMLVLTDATAWAAQYIYTIKLDKVGARLQRHTPVVYTVWRINGYFWKTGFCV